VLFVMVSEAVFSTANILVSGVASIAQPSIVRLVVP